MTDGERLCFTTALVLLVAVIAWHVLATAVCVAARCAPRRAWLARWAARSPARARRCAAYVCGVALITQPAIAHAASTDEPVVRAPTPIATAQPGAAIEPAVASPATPPPAATPPATPPPVAPSVSTNHLVAAGDNLWRIASAELERRSGASPDDLAVARYWRAVVDANRATLRSGDPSLIFPGEIVVLPAP
jgi:nucleoid-associated protein YgaU